VPRISLIHSPFQEPSRLQPILANAFVFSYVWAVAGNLSDSCSDQFDTFMRGQMEDNPEIKVTNLFTTILLEDITG